MAAGNRKPQARRPLPPGKVPPQPNFVDVAAAAGLTAVNIPLPISGASTGAKNLIAPKNFIVETTGNGVGLLDFDDDGLLDILLLQAGHQVPATPNDPLPLQPQTLYRNLGNLRFAAVPDAAGIPKLRWAQGLCAGDYDNDGKQDLVITQWGQTVLLRNQGGRFVDESARLPATQTAAGLPRWGTGCAFLDHDRDGDLDLFVAYYLQFDARKIAKPSAKGHCTWKTMAVVCGPRGLPGESMALYRNDNGRFVDVTEAAGIATPKNYYGFTVLTGDYDNDGWPDIYVACDSTASLLFRNLRNGKFEELGIASGAALNEDGREQAGMGATAGDFNRDGRLDIFKTNFTDDTPSLYRNAGNFAFDDATVSAGLAVHTKYLGWGAAFLDFDQDGWKDLLYVNGHVYPEVDDAGIGEQFRQARLLFWNRRDGQFFDLSAQAGPAIQTPHASRGLAIGDLDNDGTLEAVVSNLHEPLSLLKNMARPGGGALLVDARLPNGRAAIGARLEVTTPDGRQIDEVRSGGFHISQGDLRVHFGLAAHATANLSVRWPDGQTEQFGPVPAGHRIQVTQGAGITQKTPLAAPPETAPDAPTQKQDL